jgi:arabinogalactan endo-1,4-beta-galactosidase
LSLHYSDTWADPGQQIMPERWKSVPFVALRDSVFSYTKVVLDRVRPDLVQIGNEINGGILHPHGNSATQFPQFKQLLQAAAAAVREQAPDTQIMVHFAGLEGATWFFGQIGDIDYDLIGISYYPIWHGKSLEQLENTLGSLAAQEGKQILVAETAYPFTLGWNDWTNNIVGLENHLILPDFPATPLGQQRFMQQIRRILARIPNKQGIGLCYWGGELVAWRGNQATDGSVWENQALFDFENKELPALREIGTK